ncbi:MAG: transglutaminase family protein [Chitinophagaceae bacterium]|nr:transglutaminase family protein [Chitinophagaceae bacterium]
MQLSPESNNPKDYLDEIPPVVVFNTPLIQQKIHEIESATTNLHDRAKMAFEIARDKISHSFDTGSKVITINAEDVLQKKEGICFAKSHLLATLLRGMGIPTGFCYQRVLRAGSVDSGYALHGLNAIYFEDTGWFRVDPRGNKPGVNSQFSIEKEQLAYPIRTELGEIDYPYIFKKPLPSVLDSMHESADCHELFYKRPEMIG